MEALRASYRSTKIFELDCEGRDVGVLVHDADAIAADD
jgi:hypothetical protein